MPMRLQSLMAYSYSLWHAGWRVNAYDERIFRHFLLAERRRAERSDWRSLLVLVQYKPGPEVESGLSPMVAVRIFLALAEVVREVDFIGWYRQGRVAGAVLAQGPGSPANASRRVEERIRHAVRDRLPTRHQELQVSVVALTRRKRQ
jgi:hypothetical protein